MTKFRTLGGVRKYRSWGKWAEGDVLVGEFTEAYTDNFDKPGYNIVISSTDFSNEEENMNEGVDFGMNSSGKVDYVMERVTPGDTIQVEYLGKKLLDSGQFKGKEAHDIQISIAVSEDVTPVVEEKGAQDDFGL